MPPGTKPKPDAKRPGVRVHQFVTPEGTGWQHGRRPNPPYGLTDAGKKAWKTWLGSWWAWFYTPDDLPGLELTVRLYDRAILGEVDSAKVVPLLDRYGITPKGRQDLRWAAPESDKPAEKSTAEADEIAERRERRAAKLA